MQQKLFNGVSSTVFPLIHRRHGHQRQKYRGELEIATNWKWEKGGWFINDTLLTISVWSLKMSLALNCLGLISMYFDASLLCTGLLPKDFHFAVSEVGSQTEANGISQAKHVKKGNV